MGIDVLSKITDTCWDVCNFVCSLLVAGDFYLYRDQGCRKIKQKGGRKLVDIVECPMLAQPAADFLLMGYISIASWSSKTNEMNVMLIYEWSKSCFENDIVASDWRLSTVLFTFAMFQTHWTASSRSSRVPGHSRLCLVGLDLVPWSGFRITLCRTNSSFAGQEERLERDGYDYEKPIFPCISLEVLSLGYI